MNAISKYRTELMGIATLFVIIFHYGLPLPILGDITAMGYCGVDIFLFLSGFGLYFSLKKSEGKIGFTPNTIKKFYYRRFARVFPTYFIVNICVLAISRMLNITNIIFYSTGLGYFLRHTALADYVEIGFYEWYVPTIFGLYLLFPVIYKAVNRYPLLSPCVIFVTSILIMAVLNLCTNDNIQFMYLLSVSRMTIFAMGASLGCLIHQCFDFSRYIKPLVFISIGTLFIEYFLVKYLDFNLLWYGGLYWLPFILITPGLCIMLSWCVDWLKRRTPKCHALLYTIGSLSLEMYLIHILLIDYWKRYESIIDVDNTILVFAIGFGSFLICTFLLSYTLKLLLNINIIKRYIPTLNISR